MNFVPQYQMARPACIFTCRMFMCGLCCGTRAHYLHLHLHQAGISHARSHSELLAALKGQNGGSGGIRAIQLKQGRVEQELHRCRRT